MTLDAEIKSIIKAEAPAEIELSPGMKALRDKVQSELHGQRQLAAKMVIHGAEIGRLICEYAESPEVKKAVGDKNKEKRELKMGGRDKAEHCYVAEQLVASGVAISKHWLEQCARAFRRLQEKGAALNTPVRQSLARELPAGTKTIDVDAKIVEQFGSGSIDAQISSPEKMWPGQRAKRLPPPKRTVKEFCAAMREWLDTMESEVGELAIRRKTTQEAWADVCTEWWESRGPKCDITFN